MQDKINKYFTEVDAFNPANAEELEQFRISSLGRKGWMQDLLIDFKTLPSEQKRETGKFLNELKSKVERRIEHFKNVFASTETEKTTYTDLSRPGIPVTPGAHHPLTLVRNQITSIFQKIGFSISEGPEMEDDWHNFSALNFPPEHPARDMQDTFFISKDPDFALRTHTSSVQVRVMENSKPPIRTISPGRVYRNEAISARAHCQFHQVEGLCIDEGISFADLKQTLLYFAREFFSVETEIRLRPSYFPFTEPSAEMDISCTLCKGKGCNVCKYSGWTEIMGCGMVDPNVLDNCGIDSHKYSGFAFGMGIERIAMLKYKINDLRLFFENDVRFLKQFIAGI